MQWRDDTTLPSRGLCVLMTGWGQKRRSSDGAHVFRFSSQSRHERAVPALPSCAISGHEQSQQDSDYSMTSFGAGEQRQGAHLVLSFERQPEDELTIQRHDGVEVETDMVVDRGHVAPSALQWMAMLQAAAAGGIENQVYRRLSLIRDKRLGTPTEKPNCHRRFAIVPNLEFCCVDRVLRHQPAGVDARRRLTDALLDGLEVGDLLAAKHDGSVSLAHLVLVDEPF